MPTSINHKIIETARQAYACRNSTSKKASAAIYAQRSNYRRKDQEREHIDNKLNANFTHEPNVHMYM